MAVPFFALFSVRDCFLVFVAPEPLPEQEALADFVLVVVWELLPDVVVAVSLVFVQEATNATPTTAIMDERRDFFIVGIGIEQQELCCLSNIADPLTNGRPQLYSRREDYSARRATFGFTRAARSAGTKHDNAAIAVSSAATAR